MDTRDVEKVFVEILYVRHYNSALSVKVSGRKESVLLEILGLKGFKSLKFRSFLRNFGMKKF